MEAQVELRDIALATATTLPKPKHLKKQGQKRGILYLTSTGLIDGEMGSSHKKKRKKRGPNKSKSVVADDNDAIVRVDVAADELLAAECKTIAASNSRKRKSE